LVASSDPLLCVFVRACFQICDFGLAKTKGLSSDLSGNAGTCQWTAPEVLSGGEYHEAADVYSFGIIMHELVSRAVPYKGMTAAQVTLGVLTRGLRPPIPPNCPAQYQALMQACWDQEPSNRPPFSFIVEKLNAQLAEAKKKT
jgi:serine/threonine protein kinase